MIMGIAKSKNKATIEQAIFLNDGECDAGKINAQ